MAVQPGPIDAVQCLVTGLDGGSTAGNLSLQITPRDTFGNAITADPEVGSLACDASNRVGKCTYGSMTAEDRM